VVYAGIRSVCFVDFKKALVLIGFVGNLLRIT